MTGDWSYSTHSTFWGLHYRIAEIYCNKTTFTRHPVTMSIVSKNNQIYAIYDINRIYPINQIFNEIHQIYQKSTKGVTGDGYDGYFRLEIILVKVQDLFPKNMCELKPTRHPTCRHSCGINQTYQNSPQHSQISRKLM